MCLNFPPDTCYSLTSLDMLRYIYINTVTYVGHAALSLLLDKFVNVCLALLETNDPVLYTICKMLNSQIG